MSAQQAKKLIRLTRHLETTPPPQEIMSAIESSPDLQQDLHLAQQIDPIANAAFDVLQLNTAQSQQIENKLLEFSHKRRRKLSWKDPGVWAIAFACLLLMAYGLWHFWQQKEGFEGMDVVTQIVTAGITDIHQFEPIEVPLGDLDDWFALQSISELWIPPEFAKDVSVGARVLHVNGIAIACIAAPAQQMIIYVFPASPFHIQVYPEKHWKIFDIGTSSAAISQKGNTCFLVTSRGGKSDLEELIRNRKRK